MAMVLSPPLINPEVMISGFRVDGRLIKTYPNWVGPDFFETMGIPLLRGRFMREGESHVVMLSESLARKRWPTEDPIGKEWSTGKDTVVGIVGNTRAMELNNSDATEIYYPPTAERMPAMSVLVRTVGAPNDRLAAIKQVAGSADPKLVPTITLLKAGFEKSVAQAEEVTTVISLLGQHCDFPRGCWAAWPGELCGVAADEGAGDSAFAGGRPDGDFLGGGAAICVADSRRAGSGSGDDGWAFADASPRSVWGEWA